MPRSYVLQRLLWALPTLFGLALVVFVLLRVVPGDPIALMLPPGARSEDIARLRHVYGLDASIGVQFWNWLGQLARADLGNSISLRQGVASLVLGKLPATLELVALAMALAVSLGLGLGLAATHFRGCTLEALGDGVAGLLLAVPDFLWALVLILFLGVLHPVLPVSGRLDPGISFEPATGFFLVEALLRGRLDVAADLLRHLLLPALALALPLAGALSRVLKASLQSALEADYVMLARVKGYAPLPLLLKVALPNALIPTVTLTGVQFTFLVGGSVLIEYLFAYPGIGNLALGAVLQRDLPLIQGLILSFGVLFLATNIAVDLLVGWLDPRVRHG